MSNAASLVLGCSGIIPHCGCIGLSSRNSQPYSLGQDQQMVLDKDPRVPTSGKMGALQVYDPATGTSRIAPDIAVRRRSHDEMVSTNGLKEKRKQCRQTIEVPTSVGATTFRCDLKHNTDEEILHHREQGIIKRPGHPDVHYTFTWEEHESMVVRTKVPFAT